MERINDLLDGLFEVIYDNLLGPLFHGIALLLTLLIAPLGSCSPFVQIVVVSAFAAIISRILSRVFRSRREKVLMEEFRERLSTLKYTEDLGDREMERAIRKGISRSADSIYEKIVLDKFFEMGVSYFLPLFFFLIWLEYSLFTPRNLKALTGSPYAWTTGQGSGLSAAYVYIISFNILLTLFWVMEWFFRLARKRGKRPEHQ